MLQCVTLGSYLTNCWILKDEATGDALAVDCPVFNGALRAALREMGVESLKYILLTHGHFDHVCGVKALKDAFGGQVCIHAADAACLVSAAESLALQMGNVPQEPCPADLTLGDGDSLPFGAGAVRVMHTPGHTKGSVCYFYRDVMFSGDTLFYLSMGRTDLPGGSTEALLASLRAVGRIPGDYRVCPGHGEPTSLAFEKRSNRYLRAV